MRTPLFLLTLSLAAFGALYLQFGPEITLPLAVAALSSVAAFLLVLGALLRRPKPAEAPAQKTVTSETVRAMRHQKMAQPLPLPNQPAERPVIVPAPKPKRRRWPLGKRPNVVIDGSNAMYWNGDTPRLTTLREVVAAAHKRGYQPGIIFDANAGYRLCERYLDDSDFAKLLKLPGDRVLVVPSGEPADPVILSAARDLSARIITNDRYRDWAGDFPEVAMEGHLIQGGYDAGALWLEDEVLRAAA